MWAIGRNCTCYWIASGICESKVTAFMFLEFYGLKEQPFGVTPDPRFICPSRTHSKAFNSLLRGLEAGCGFLALIPDRVWANHIGIPTPEPTKADVSCSPTIPDPM